MLSGQALRLELQSVYMFPPLTKLSVCTAVLSWINSVLHNGQPNFRAGSTFPVLVCTVPSSMDRTCPCNKVDAVRLYSSYRLNLLLQEGQRWVTCVLLILLVLGQKLDLFLTNMIGIWTEFWPRMKCKLHFNRCNIFLDFWVNLFFLNLYVED